ncbi:ORF6N domain-containing protein [Desulfovibrio sp. OttesenSCG-928-G15]|nr:ORF6N domain-containing protein [Desulfovibrio sp. OttesenSCG-928-G15]
MTNDVALSLETVVHRIVEFRGQRVMLDSDLAVLYGVETGALVRAMKRNQERFEDFTFQLSGEEWESLRCQFGISNKGRGGRRFAPYAFTEHGALMLSSVLNSPRAVEVSRLIIRAFVWMRQTVPAYQELAAKLMELESTVSRHDSDISMILDALRQLVTPQETEKRRIGF